MRLFVIWNIAKEVVESAMDINDQDVIAYLKNNPNFILHHPEVMEFIQPPSRRFGQKISDFQSVMIKSLQAQISTERAIHDTLIDNSHDNFTNLQQIHESILGLIAARSLGQLMDSLSHDMLENLNLDVINVCYESDKHLSLTHPALRLITPGTIAHLLPEACDYALHSQIVGHPALLGARALSVQSQAIGRLYISPKAPEAIVVFASRNPDMFDPAQSTELLAFLTQTLAILLRIQLLLPDYSDNPWHAEA